MTKTALSLPDLQSMLSESAFHRVLNVDIDSVDEASDILVMRLPFSPNVERAPGSGQYHGGAIASLIDIAGDFAIAWRLGHGVPTVNFRTDYIRPAFGGDLLAHARVRRVGRTVAVCDVDVIGADGQLLALGRATYATKAG